MFTINIYKKVGLLLIGISISLIIVLKVYQYIDYKKHSIIIDNIFKNGQINEFDYIGYIEIESLNIKREIVLGITDENLDKNIVAMDKKSVNLENEHIVLAGHSVQNVFGNLHYINIGDEIKIVSFYETNYYVVKDIKIVKKTDIDALNGDLCLITCMNNPDERLIIYAEKKIS